MPSLQPGDYIEVQTTFPLRAIISWPQCDQHFRDTDQQNRHYQIGLIVRSHLKSLRVNDQGTTAVEFAIVAPVFITLLIGTLALCVALFLIGSLHYAAEEGARCASVKTACQVNGVADAAATRTYAQNHYFGPTGPRTRKPGSYLLPV
jgi:hypothetical protein